MLDANTYSNNSVINYIYNNFIPFKINAESKQGSTLFEQYQGTGYPLIIFIDSNNNELDRLYGYYPYDDFILKLGNISKGINTYPDLLGKYKLGDTSAETMFNLALKTTDRGNDSLATILYENVIIHKDVSWDMFHQSKLALGISSLKNNQLILKDYIQNYPDSPVLSAAINHLLNYYNTNSIINEELNLYNKYITKFNNDPWFLNQYAWRMTELDRDLENALQKINLSLNIVLEDKQQRAMILDTKAEIFWKLKKFEDAIITINQCIDFDPENSYYKNQKNKFLQSIN